MSRFADTDWTALRRSVEDAGRIFERVGMFEAWADALPFPAWLKDPNLRMRWINAAYRRRFPEVSARYIGRTDFEVWPNQVASAFRANDLEVIQAGRAVLAVEPTDSESVLVAKFPVPVFRGQPSGIGGLALPLPDVLDATRKGEA